MKDVSSRASSSLSIEKDSSSTEIASFDVETIHLIAFRLFFCTFEGKLKEDQNF
jgi:hypothetical protein